MEFVYQYFVGLPVFITSQSAKKGQILYFLNLHWFEIIIQLLPQGVEGRSHTNIVSHLKFSVYTWYIPLSLASALWIRTI